MSLVTGDFFRTSSEEHTSSLKINTIGINHVLSIGTDGEECSRYQSGLDGMHRVLLGGLDEKLMMNRIESANSC